METGVSHALTHAPPPRFANVDFAYLSMIQFFYRLLLLFVGYDIICQYIIHLLERLRQAGGGVRECARQQAHH